MALTPEQRKEQREKLFRDAIAQIKKAMPDDTVGVYKEIGSDIDIETLSTGSLAVDAVIGGGLAKGKIINIVGKTSSGKTTLALTAIAELQKENPDANIMFVDGEQALDPKYAKSLGVDLDKILLVQPSCGENGFEAIEIFINSGVADMVVLDSVASMKPKALLETRLGEDGRIGSMARLVGSAVSKIYRIANQNKTTVILINQLKPMVKTSMYQVTGNSVFGQWYQPGGEDMPFYCSQILEIAKTSTIKEGDKSVSNVIKMTCRKNKIAPPFTTAEFYITFGKGVDKIQELVGLGKEFGIIELIGRSYWSIPGLTEERVNGRQAFVKFLESRPDLCNEIEKQIKEKIKGAQSIELSSKDEEIEYNEENSEENQEYLN